MIERIREPHTTPRLSPRGMPVLVVAILLLPSTARAGQVEAKGTGVTHYHKGQVGVHAQAGAGYRVLMPYNSEFCGQAGKTVCTGRSPTFLELGISYGVTRSIELLADVRLGLETDFGAGSAEGPRALAIAPGIKVFVEETGLVKFFSTLQGVVDFTDFAFTGVKEGADLGLRNVNGILIDLHANYGLYAHFGETFGLRRWLRFEIDGGAGIQGRFP
ncbi:MAG: hypothetical protein HY698_19970 [Deltaproteobacteria bacterium]|nr:hypothetical protein [Deltaproteobacteria bacterium]